MASPNRLLAHTGGVDDDHLAGFDVAHEVGADDVEGGGLAGEHPATGDPAEHQRAEAVPVAHADEMGLVHEHERERARQVGQHLLERGLEVAPVGPGLGRVRPRQQLGNEIGVGGRVGQVLGAVIPGSIPRLSASSAVLVRFPLWPRANPASPTDR